MRDKIIKKISIVLLLFANAASAVAFTNDLVAITSINSHIKLDIRYATTNNFTGRQVYPSKKAYQPPRLLLFHEPAAGGCFQPRAPVRHHDRMRFCAL